jgi:mutator protein MutT
MADQNGNRLQAKVASFVLLQNDKGELLLQKRANTGYMDGYWDASASGHLEYGESAVEAAIRELEEELNVLAQPEYLRLIHIYHAYLDTPYINFIFITSKWQGEPTINEPDKCTEIKYFSVKDLPANSTRGVRMAASNNFSETVAISKLTPENFEEYFGEAYVA